MKWFLVMTYLAILSYNPSFQSCLVASLYFLFFIILLTAPEMLFYFDAIFLPLIMIVDLFSKTLDYYYGLSVGNTAVILGNYVYEGIASKFYINLSTVNFSSYYVPDARLDINLSTVSFICLFSLRALSSLSLVSFN